MFEFDEIEKRLLIVDDCATARRSLLDVLSEKYPCDESKNAEEALLRVLECDYAVILCDVVLPGVSGIDALSEFQARSPQSVVILVSGEQSVDFAVKSFRAGAFDFLQKPFHDEQVLASVERALEHYELRLLKDRYQYHMEELVAERTQETDNALRELENSYRTTLKALVQALETRDTDTVGHSERVVGYSLRLAQEMKLDQQAIRDLELGAMLHDVGKISVPDAILRKPAQLNHTESRNMQLHPVLGQNILRNIPFLDGAVQIVLQHHERWDGTGYPYGVRGDEIDLGARIFSVIDAYDAMTSDRVYRKRIPYEDAIKELERCVGTQFDPLVVLAFKRIPYEELDAIYQDSQIGHSEGTLVQLLGLEMMNGGVQLEAAY